MTIGDTQMADGMEGQAVTENTSESPREVREWDLVEVRRWYSARNDRWPGSRMLSSRGLIVKGVAAGWLVTTDSSWAIIEGFITNPEAPAESRNRALDSITDGLVEMARKLGYSSVVALFTDTSIGERARRHGLRDIGLYRMMSKEI